MAKWFAPKRLGYGWRPVTWQGWAITIGGAFAIAAIIRAILQPRASAGRSGAIS